MALKSTMDYTIRKSSLTLSSSALVQRSAVLVRSMKIECFVGAELNTKRAPGHNRP